MKDLIDKQRGDDVLCEKEEEVAATKDIKQQFKSADCNLPMSKNWTEAYSVHKPLAMRVN